MAEDIKKVVQRPLAKMAIELYLKNGPMCDERLFMAFIGDVKVTQYQVTKIREELQSVGIVRITGWAHVAALYDLTPEWGVQGTQH
jgi:hypothetical protein